jgi:hypothetical protein
MKKKQLLDFIDKLKLESLLNENTTKVGFQLDHIWANVLKNECKNGEQKAIFLQIDLYCIQITKHTSYV